MKHSVSAAAIALALGFGLATVAQAHGISDQSAMPQTHVRSAQIQHKHARKATRKVVRRANPRVKQVQEALKSKGLYKGRIDGVMGRSTRRAIALFQKKNRLRQTATLNRATRNRLMGSRAVGVGSSMPHKGAKMTTPNPNAGNPNLGATNMQTPPSTPPSNPNMTGAGSNNATGNPNPTK